MAAGSHGVIAMNWGPVPTVMGGSAALVAVRIGVTVFDSAPAMAAAAARPAARLVNVMIHTASVDSLISVTRTLKGQTGAGNAAKAR